MQNEKLIEEIKNLKKEKNAVILVHNYQRPEIYEIADYLGDSLDLSKAATKTHAKIILFCGVDFMAETAKILNPDKKVLIPSKQASCPMAAMVSAEEIKKLREKYPDAAVISYVNTMAETKAESDICCTSRNFLEVAESISNKEIIFTPDKNMAKYLQTKTDKKIIPWNGFCYVHNKITPEMVKKAKENYPEAKVIAHPECPLEVLELAQGIFSTQGMIKFAKEDNAKEFIVVTEEGMCNRLKKEVPDKKFYPLGGVCFNMKEITLENVLEALKEEKHEIEISEETRIKAKKAVEAMMNVKIKE